MAKKRAERQAAKAVKQAEKAAIKAAKEAQKAAKEAEKVSKQVQHQSRLEVPRGNPKVNYINTNRKKNSLDNTVFSDLCCVCFGSYDEDAGTDRQWCS